MHRIGKRYYARVGHADLDFKVSAIDSTGEFFVEVAVRSHLGAILSRDLELCLADSNFRPLKRLSHTCGGTELMSVQMSGVTSSFKAERFADDPSAPGYLLITFYGQTEVIQLCPPGKEGPPEPEPPEPEPPPRPRDGGAKRAPPAPKCCPDTLTTPRGAQPSTVRRARNAAGVVVQVAVECRPWVAQATFNAQPPPCDCTCCEYHQLIKGTFTVTPAGGGPAQDISPVTDYVVPPGGGAPVAVKGVNANNFVTDSIGDPANPGNPLTYGDRNNIGPRPGQVGYINQDYPDPCSYWGFDGPKAIRMAPGVTLNVNLTFRACIVDRCSQGSVEKGPNDWTWTFNGVVQ